MDKYVKKEYLFKVIKESNLLNTLTVLPTAVTIEENNKSFEVGGLVYLKKYSSLLTLHKKELNENHLLIIAAGKGNLPTFLFWKTFFNMFSKLITNELHLRSGLCRCRCRCNRSANGAIGSR